MSHPEVDQLSVLNRIFAEVYSEFCPKRLAVIGCAAGNGFEHIAPSRVQRVVGIDVNASYLDILARRFPCLHPALELRCADARTCRFAPASFDLIHAALVFEYLEPGALLERLAPWLSAGGTLSAVLQLPSDTRRPVSQVGYESLNALDGFMRLVPVADFEADAARAGLCLLRRREVPLRGGKRFACFLYARKPSTAAT